MSSDDLCTCGHPRVFHGPIGCDYSGRKYVYGDGCSCTAFAPAAVREATGTDPCKCGHGPRQHAARQWDCYVCGSDECADYTPAAAHTASNIQTHEDPYRNTRPAPARQVSVTVPAEKIEALREAIKQNPGPFIGNVTYIVEAAWDLVVPVAQDWIDDPSTTSQEKLDRFYSLNPEPTTGPHEVSVTDTIENVLREHEYIQPKQNPVSADGWISTCTCGEGRPWHPHTAHVAAVIAQRLEAK